MLKLTKGRDLSQYDLEVLIDTSCSMGHTDTPSGQSRLEDTKKMVGLLVSEMGEYDTDGITIGCFDTSLHDVHENTTDATAQTVLSRARATGSGTDTALALESRIQSYFTRRFATARKGLSWAKAGNPSTKPVIIVVITDGAPNNQQAVARVIVAATQRLEQEGLNRDALGIAFIQTGRDAAAKSFLEWLDDGLEAAGAAMDIVNSLTVDDCIGLTTKQILESALDD